MRPSRSLFVLLLAVAVPGFLASCRSDPTPSTIVVTTTAAPTTATAATGPLPTVTGPFSAGREAPAGFGELAVRVIGPDGEVRVFCVLLADTAAQRQRGLMTVTDPTLGGYDGMLFEFDGDVTGGFWMRNTAMPLTIAYLDATGAPVGTFDMEPCRDLPSCPSYRPDAPYRRALEVPQGHLQALGLEPGAHLEPAGACRPAD